MAKERNGTGRVLVTPEGVPLNLRLGGAGQRLAAFLLDLVIIVGSLFVVTLGILLMSFAVGPAVFNIAAVLWLIGFFFLRTCYFTLLEMGSRAATFGKRVIGLRVVARDGGRLTADAIIARNLMRELEFFLPLSYLAIEAADNGVESAAWVLGAIWVAIFLFFPLFNRDRLRAGDLIAGTWVIHVPRQALTAELSPVADQPAFTPEQLSAYGIYELQTLEQVLRGGNSDGISITARAIRSKIGPGGPADDYAFLRDYYAALRTRLERDLLLGKRRADKHG